MSKTPFLIIVAGALLALHLHSARHVEPSVDSRMVWTTRQGGRLEASLQIPGKNQARIVIWRSSSRADGGFEVERKILDQKFTDATSHPHANPVLILEQAQDSASTRYRFEIFTTPSETTDWRSLSGAALIDYPAKEGRGIILNFEDSLNPSGRDSDFRDIILSLRES